MKRLSIALAVLMLFTVCLVAAGCGADETTTTTAAQPATTAPPTTGPATTATTAATAPASTDTSAAAGPKSGGTLRVILSPDLQNAGGLPWELWGPQMMAGQFILESLFVGTPKGDFEPGLAKEYKLADDLSSITITLNQGIKFHDGSDFNADVVKWNFEQYMKAGQAPSFKAVTVVDPYTIKVDFNFWANTNLVSFRDGLWIISEQNYEKNGEEYARANPCGTGPFKFVSFENAVKMEMTKNENYWQAGKPYLDAVEILFVQDEQTKSAMLQAGEADCIGNQGLNKSAKDLKDAGFVIETWKPECWAIQPDAGNADSPYKDQKVREAVEYAIDRQALADAFGYGFWEAVDQIPGPDASIYNPNPPLVRNYDPEKAKQLLTEAGYPNGFKTSLVMLQFANQDQVVAVQAMLAEVGIDAELVIPEGPIKFNEATNTMHNILAWSPVDALSGSWNQGFWYSFMFEGSGNKNWLRSPEWVELYNKSRAAPKEEIALDQAVTDQWTKEASVIPVTRGGNGWAHATYVMDGGWFSRSFSPWIKPWNIWLDK
jgi:peptide/nickel transport system substrate-binding protein